MLVEELRPDLIMAIGEDVDLDQHLLAERALRGVAPAVDLRAYRLDDDSRRSIRV